MTRNLLIECFRQINKTLEIDREMGKVVGLVRLVETWTMSISNSALLLCNICPLCYHMVNMGMLAYFSCRLQTLRVAFHITELNFNFVTFKGSVAEFFFRCKHVINSAS